MHSVNSDSVRRFPDRGNFLTFVEEFLLRNEPCLFGEEATRGWRARALWQKEGRPDLDYLAREFGSAVVPVADCSHERFSAHPKAEMRLSEYTGYWRTLLGEPECSEVRDKPGRSSERVEDDRREERDGRTRKLLYLKDWHIARDFPSYNTYSLLEFFHCDWLNELWDLRQDVCDDYRFVYMGPAGTWTPFHADVFRSYSWSANVCGRKEWLLFPPGEEDQLRDRLGNLPLDVTSHKLSDRVQYPNARRSCGPIRVVQGPGEVIFIPSGWHHQVKNVEDTISVNHNWTNAFGLQRMWSHLSSELRLVQHEIADCKEMDGWEAQCQVILKASAGMDYHEFLQLLCLVALPRMQEFVDTITKAFHHSPESLPSLGFQKLKVWLTRALCCKSYSFFGLRRDDPKECTTLDEPVTISMDSLCKECLSVEPVARDNVAAILRGCLQSCAGDHSGSVLGELLAVLPDETRKIVEQMMSFGGHGHATEQSLLVTFRGYELLCIQTVMADLIHSREFTAVSPQF